MKYQGPIYRPPSEADSLLVQATLGCPHNKCSFCMTYKKGPPFSVRPLEEITADLEEAAGQWGRRVRTLFLPAGNSLAMPTGDLAEICRRAHEPLSPPGTHNRVRLHARHRGAWSKGPGRA